MSECNSLYNSEKSQKLNTSLGVFTHSNTNACAVECNKRANCDAYLYDTDVKKDNCRLFQTKNEEVCLKTQDSKLNSITTRLNTVVDHVQSMECDKHADVADTVAKIAKDVQAVKPAVVMPATAKPPVVKPAVVMPPAAKPPATKPDVKNVTVMTPKKNEKKCSDGYHLVKGKCEPVSFTLGGEEFVFSSFGRRNASGKEHSSGPYGPDPIQTCSEMPNEHFFKDKSNQENAKKFDNILLGPNVKGDYGNPKTSQPAKYFMNDDSPLVPGTSAENGCVYKKITR